MDRRLELQELFLTFAPNVYFQAPPSTGMKYPCILYKRQDVHVDYADNSPYKNRKRYKVTVIDLDPDSLIPDKVGALPLCSYDRYFAVDQLNHDVYNLFF